MNVGLYKDGKILIVKRNLRVGDFAELKPTDKLYFCCMEVEMKASDINKMFSSGGYDDIDFIDAEFFPLFPIDLKHYPEGVNISLQENEDSGQLKFITKPLHTD